MFEVLKNASIYLEEVLGIYKFVTARDDFFA